MKKQKKQSKKQNSLSFLVKLISFSFLFFLFLIILINTILKLINFNTEKYIDYSEQGNLNYKVYLKENDFYEQDYLEEDMIYISSLIDKISVDFNYQFSINETIDLEFSYDIIGRLNIYDKDEKSVYFTKEYVLLENQQEEKNNLKNHSITKNIDINYNYYNKLANEFKTSYGLDTKSVLTVYLNIKKENSGQDNITNLNSNSSMYVQIPLSEKSINISMNHNDINNKMTIVKTNNNPKTNLIGIVISIIFFIIDVIFLSKLIRLIMSLMKKTTKYEKYLKKILNEYDRLIVETTTIPNLEDKTIEIIKINQFDELLDVRDNLKLPIMHYIEIPNKKSHFYIRQESLVYIYTIKENDFHEK